MGRRDDRRQRIRLAGVERQVDLRQHGQLRRVGDQGGGQELDPETAHLDVDGAAFTGEGDRRRIGLEPLMHAAHQGRHVRDGRADGGVLPHQMIDAVQEHVDVRGPLDGLVLTFEAGQGDAAD
ncbi:hypothetical protein D3C87_1758230 [compost metagenome]